jgi:hypothetical protein
MDLEEAIRALRENNEDVPRPLRLPTPAEVNAMARTLGVTFHPDYERYLLEASDVVLGTLEPATIVSRVDHTYLPSVVEGARAMGVPGELLPICEDNGDYYCMQLDGRVVDWSHNGVTDESWPNLAAWISDVWLAS